jgi:hypothetical protein
VGADFKWAFSVLKTRRLSGNRSPVRPFVGAGLAAWAFPGKTRNRSGRFDAELPLIMLFGWMAGARRSGHLFAGIGSMGGLAKRKMRNCVSDLPHLGGRSQGQENRDV